VRKVPTPSGPFPFQLYFEDLGEIDEICLEALKRQSLLPSKPAPIRIERFVEKEFKTALRYEDLSPDNLGCTIFNSLGALSVANVAETEHALSAPLNDAEAIYKANLEMRGFYQDVVRVLLRLPAPLHREGRSFNPDSDVALC